MAITVCTISGSIGNLLGAVPGDLAITQAKLWIKNQQSFMHGDVLISPFELSAAFDAVTGIVSLPVMETTTPGVYLQMFVQIKEGRSTRTILFEPVMIPNSAGVTLGTLAGVRRQVW